MERYSRQVYYYETDKMAIVHHSNYIRIFEEARIDFMAKSGIPFIEIENAGIQIPVVDVYAKYHESLRYGDTFLVTVTLTQFTGIRMEFAYEVRRAGDEVLCASGHSGHCFIDESTRLPLHLKKRMPEAFEQMKSALAAE